MGGQKRMGKGWNFVSVPNVTAIMSIARIICLPISMLGEDKNEDMEEYKWKNQFPGILLSRSLTKI